MRASRLLIAIMLLAGLARGQSEQAPPRDVVPARPSMWRDEWPTFSWWEGAATVAAGAGTLVLLLNPPPAEPNWQGGILFDDAIRDGLRLESASARRQARSIGDWPYYAAGVLPLVVDPVLVAWLAEDDPKAALNLALIGVEAFSYAGVLSFISTRLSARERPDATECRRQQPAATCEPDTEAFWSGHTSIAAASAGLVCANHLHLPLWRQPALDVGACVLASAGATLTGVSRLMSDRHYTTDIIAGAAVGFAVGYAVPVMFHYRRRRTDVVVSVQASVSCPNGCVTVGGSF